MKLFFLVTITFGALVVHGQNQYPETEEPNNMAAGVYYQSGPGSNNGTFNWSYPYGTKLTVMHSGYRNFEFATTNYPWGYLKFRQYDPTNSDWSSWREIFMTGQDGYFKTELDLKLHKTSTRGHSILTVNRGSEGKDRALVSFGEDSNPLWFAGLLYGGGWLTPDFYISKSSDFRNGGVITHTPEFTIKSSGNIGIGTRDPDAKLAVKGDIHAEEVKVDLQVPGPDYVFNKDYELRSLEEVQRYIDKHGHLPNIPSAREMEQNGIELGTMNMKLLEKIEELTLYIIELKRDHSAQIEELKSKIK